MSSPDCLHEMEVELHSLYQYTLHKQTNKTIYSHGLLVIVRYVRQTPPPEFGLIATQIEHLISPLS